VEWFGDGPHRDRIYKIERAQNIQLAGMSSGTFGKNPV
jgi:hypothetical protein